MIRYCIDLLVDPIETGNARNPAGSPMEDLEAVGIQERRTHWGRLSCELRARVKTAYRDLEAIQEVGFPVFSDRVEGNRAGGSWRVTIVFHGPGATTGFYGVAIVWNNSD